MVLMGFAVVTVVASAAAVGRVEGLAEFRDWAGDPSCSTISPSSASTSSFCIGEGDI